MLAIFLDGFRLGQAQAACLAADGLFKLADLFDFGWLALAQALDQKKGQSDDDYGNE